MCWSSGGHWETFRGAVLLFHTMAWDWHLSLFTIPILFSPQSKCLAHCPVVFLLPSWADARLVQLGQAAWGPSYPRSTPPRLIHLLSYWDHPGVCGGLVALVQVVMGAAVSCFPRSARSMPRSRGSPSPRSCVP